MRGNDQFLDVLNGQFLIYMNFTEIWPLVVKVGGAVTAAAGISLAGYFVWKKHFSHRSSDEGFAEASEVIKTNFSTGSIEKQGNFRYLAFSTGRKKNFSFGFNKIG